MPRSSSCRARWIGWRICGNRAEILRRPRQPHGLYYRGGIVEAVHEDRQPGRVEAIAEITEQKPDREHFAEEEPVILQMQRRPYQRRQQDGAGGSEKGLPPAAVEKAAREQVLRG